MHGQERHREIRQIDGTEWDIRSEHEAPDPWAEYHSKLQEAVPAKITITSAQSFNIDINTGDVFYINNSNGKFELIVCDETGETSFVALGHKFGKTQASSCGMDYWHSGSRAARRNKQFARRTRTEGWENVLVQGRLQCGQGCSARHSRTKGRYR